MPTGIIVSLAGHVVLIVMMAFGLPALLTPESQELSVQSVGVVTEAELAALTEPRLPPAREAAQAEPETAADPQAAEAAQTAQTDAARDAQAEAAEAPEARSVEDASAAPAAVARDASEAARPPAPDAQAPDPAVVAPESPRELAAVPPPETAPQPPPDAATAEAPPLPPVRQSPPEVAAAPPPDPAEPAAPTPPEPAAPAPKEALAQAPQPQRPRAKGTPLPPKRPPELIPPDTQLAEAPPRAAPRQQTDFFSSMQSAIGEKSGNDGMAGVAASLGVGVAGGALSQTDRDAIASRLGGCWRPTLGAANLADLVVELVVRLGPTSEVQDIRVSERPPASAGRAGQVAVDRARQAIQKCNPLNKFGQLTLPPDRYRDWREMRIRFDPRSMAG